MPIRFVQTLLFGFVVSAAACACAGPLLFETRATTTEVLPWDALASWNAQSSAVSASELDEFTRVFSSGSYLHSHLQLQFDTGGAPQWSFEFGLDAGFGGAIYLNGEQHAARQDDLWWDNDWDATDELLSLSSGLFMNGINTIDVYWAEACCSGWQSGRFSTNDGVDWQALSLSNLESVSVPEPATLGLLATGILGCMLARRRVQKPLVA